jgi:hypothetical protein
MIRLLLICLLTASATAAPDLVPHVRRVAIVVGANEPPAGYQALRFAHADAERMSEVLRRVGDFSDVKVLLDPRPSEVLATLDQAKNADLVLFYYSGHSDGHSLFPHGETLSIADVRDRLAHLNVRVRVGILDTCRGGEWTHTKGLTVGPPLDPIDLLNVATEGTALIASSAGLENAHEGDAVKGSFFTHHFAAGLLGAADTSGDGDITLQEAFDYAKERTVRDTALLAPTPQHPSFDIDLRGRQDLVLASTRTSTSALAITNPREILQVVHLDSGLVIAEAPPSSVAVRLAVAPGQYLVRRDDGAHVWAKQVTVRANETIAVTDTDLQLSGTPEITVKGVTTPTGKFLFQLGAGVTTGPEHIWGAAPFEAKTSEMSDALERSATMTGSLTYKITDRLTWAVATPAFSYRLGEAGRLELVPRAGLTGIGYSSIEGLVGTADAGTALRAWTSPTFSVIGNAVVDYNFSTGLPATRGVLSLSANAGIAWEPSPFLSLHLATGVTIPHRTTEPDDMSIPLTSTFAIGSIQTLGYNALPLLQIHISPQFSLDGYASWSVDAHGGAVRDRYLAGFTWQF